jgi:hypothetical protein
MASLLDIAPIVVTVSVRGQDIPVTGLPVAKFAELLRDYPTLRSMIDGAWKRGGVSIDAKALFAEVPDAVHDIIASGVVDRTAGHDVLLAHVMMLGAADQLALLRGVMEATMPEGPGPFVDVVASILAGSWGSPAKPTEESLPGGLVVSEPSSPPPLSAALVVDSTGLQPGRSHRGNSSLSAN